MEDKKYVELIEQLFDKNKQPTKDDIYNWLVTNEWRIASSYERFCHKEDLKQEFEERGHEIPDDSVLELLLDRFEDNLSDSEEWHFILNEIVDDYVADKNLK